MRHKDYSINESEIFLSDKEYEFLIGCMDLFMVIDEYCLKSLNNDQIYGFLNSIRNDMNDVYLPNDQ